MDFIKEIKLMIILCITFIEAVEINKQIPFTFLKDYKAILFQKSFFFENDWNKIKKTTCNLKNYDNHSYIFSHQTACREHRSTIA